MTKECLASTNSVLTEVVNAPAAATVVAQAVVVLAVFAAAEAVQSPC